MGKIFDKILIRHYPEMECVSLDDLLQWDLWPNYILIYSESCGNYSLCLLYIGTLIWLLTFAKVLNLPNI